MQKEGKGYICNYSLMDSNIHILPGTEFNINWNFFTKRKHREIWYYTTLREAERTGFIELIKPNRVRVIRTWVLSSPSAASTIIRGTEASGTRFFDLEENQSGRSLRAISGFSYEEASVYNNNQFLKKPTMLFKEELSLHNKTQKSIYNLLMSFGITIKNCIFPGGFRPDLVAEYNGYAHIIEVKTLSGRGSKQFQRALGQVIQYNYLLDMYNKNIKVGEGFIVTDRKPIDLNLWNNCCRENDIFLCYPGNLHNIVNIILE